MILNFNPADYLNPADYVNPCDGRPTNPNNKWIKMVTNEIIHYTNKSKRTAMDGVVNIIKPHLSSSFTREYEINYGQMDKDILSKYLIKWMKNIYPSSYRTIPYQNTLIPKKYGCVDVGKYFFVLDKVTFLVIEVIENKYDFSINKSVSGAKFTFYGKNHSKWNKRILYDFEKFVTKSKTNKMLITEDHIIVNYHTCSVLKSKCLNRLTMNDIIHPYKTEVIDLIKRFINARYIYNKYKMPYHLGILLYGEQGTGKTSFINLIASEIKRGIDVISVDEFHECASSLEAQRIYVIEEIDTMMNVNDTLLSRCDDNSYHENKSKNVAMMRNFLIDMDRIPDGTIIVATTNHIEKLDPSVIRDGRFDIKVKFEPFTKLEALEMIHKFNETEESIRSVVPDIELSGINPAKLENIIRQKKIQEVNIKFDNSEEKKS